MPAKSPKPLKLINPSEENTVRLQYAQRLNLTLYDPRELKYPEGSQWVVHVEGHYLKKTLRNDTHGDDGTTTKITIDQDKTRSCWQELSHTFLGNIYIALKLPDQDKLVRFSCVVVFLDCRNSNRQNIVTVIDPISTTEVRQLVKVEPRQVLEVVVTDQDAFERLAWRAYPLPLRLGDAYLMEQFHYEFLPIGELTGSVSYHGDKPYYCERRVYTGDDEIVPLGEHHFFFGFQNLDPAAVQRLPNGCHLACAITMVGKGTARKGRVKDQRLVVGLTLRKAIRRREAALLRAPKAEVPTFKPRERLEDSVERRLVNPRKTEQIYLAGDGDCFTIDIATPSVYYPKASDKVKAYWRFRVESAHRSNKHVHCIEVEAHSGKWINDYHYQRFTISLNRSPQVEGERMLGKVVLFCKDLDGTITDPNITLYILLNRNRVERDTNPKISSSFQQMRIGSEVYNISNRSAVSSSENPVESTYCRGTQTKQKKRNKRSNLALKNEHQLEYWEVEIEDKGNDLTAGEKIEYLSNVTFASDFDYSEDPDSEYYSMGAFMEHRAMCNRLGRRNKEVIDAEFAVIEEESKKKRSSGNGGLCENNSSGKSDSGDGISESPNGSTESRRQNERRTGISIPDAKPPCELYWPQNRQFITLERGRPFVVYLLLPKGEFKSSALRKQWTPNIVNTKEKDGFRLWMESTQVKESEDGGLKGFPYQEIRILPLSPRGAEPGRYRIGSLKLDDGDGNIKMITFDLDVKGGDREDLRYWKNYYSTLIRSRCINFGKTAKIRPSSVENRTTLIDPIGTTTDIPVNDWHELEIILTKPHTFSDSGVWMIHAHMLKGEIVCLDASEHYLFSGEKIHRYLYRIDRKDDLLFGEIKISWDGEDTNTRICPYYDEVAADNRDGQIVPKTSSVRVVGDVKDDTKVRFEDWNDGEHITIFPTDRVYIQVPETTPHLAASHRLAAKWARWHVELEEVIIENEVWAKLPEGLRDEVDPLAPYYDYVGLFSSGDTPWQAKEFVLRPLIETQPYIYEIIDTLREHYGPQRGYPMAVATFEHKIGNEFTIRRTVHIDVGDPEFGANDTACTVLDNPADNKKFTVDNEATVSIRLPYKWRKWNSQKMEHVRWRCCEIPNWLVRLDYEDDHENDREVYNFRTELSPGTYKSTGKLCFDCGDGYLQKKLLLVCIR